MKLYNGFFAFVGLALISTVIQFPTTITILIWWHLFWRATIAPKGSTNQQIGQMLWYAPLLLIGVALMSRVLVPGLWYHLPCIYVINMFLFFEFCYCIKQIFNSLPASLQIGKSNQSKKSIAIATPNYPHV